MGAIGILTRWATIGILLLNCLVVPWKYEFDPPGSAKGPSVVGKHAPIFLPPPLSAAVREKRLEDSYWTVEFDSARWWAQSFTVVAILVFLNLTPFRSFKRVLPAALGGKKEALDTRIDVSEMKQLLHEMEEALEDGQTRRVVELIRLVAAWESRYWARRKSDPQLEPNLGG